VGGRVKALDKLIPLPLKKAYLNWHQTLLSKPQKQSPFDPNLPLDKIALSILGITEIASLPIFLIP
jgi:hypothetical protein